MAKLKWGFLGVLCLGFCLGIQNPVQASPLGLATSRISGARQIDTAIEISKTGWSRHADSVILANCDYFPDAMVAAPLSHKLDAPVLLTPVEGVDAKVLAEIKRLGAKQVILLGGEAALSPQVEADIQKIGLDKPERIAGYDQYETSQKVAERVGFKGQVILASGEQFPDALAISAYAGVTETPILLTMAKQMPAVIKQELTSLQQKGNLNTIVVGGEAVISSDTLTSIQNVKRISGNDRYDTAAEVYEFAETELFTQTRYLVTGENFPDALAAGALAAKQRAGIVMAQRATLPEATYLVLSKPTDGPVNVVIIGGIAVITDQLKAVLEESAQSTNLLEGLTIVVDPGHGGPDTGAIAASGAYEKTNNLAIGLDLAVLLRSAGAKVVLTRSTDVTPAAGEYSERSDLRARTEVANNAEADLFISLHNDAFSNSEVVGTTTYYSSDSSAGDQSEALATSIQSELLKAVDLPSRGVKAANFYVIKYTTMPSVLVEVGFISNPAEAELLESPEFQQKAAFGVYNGILKYKGY